MNEWIYSRDRKIRQSVKQEHRGTITACAYRCPESTGWVSRGLTSHSTLYRSFQGLFLQARWPNQQCQSTEGNQVATEICFNPTRTTQTDSLTVTIKKPSLRLSRLVLPPTTLDNGPVHHYKSVFLSVGLGLPFLSLIIYVTFSDVNHNNQLLTNAEV